MTETITSGQRKQIVRFCEDGLEDAQIGKDVAQRAIEKGDEFQERMVALINELGELPYADEETESNYGYPDGFRIRTVQEQVESLIRHFPNLDASHVEELANGELPEGAEGWAVIPKFDKLGKNYHQALETVLGLIAKDREFRNWRKGELTGKHMKLSDKTAQSHVKLNEQPGHFWVVPFQFGIRHRGKSVRRARAVFTETEFGLGSYEVAVLLLTHPDRIQHGHLNIDCTGVEYAPSADGAFFACLDFSWCDDYERLVLDCYGTDDTSHDEWGSASAFLPPSLR